MYSKLIELEKLPSKRASAVITELKKIFSLHGIPVKVFVENNPYNSLEFKLFAINREDLSLNNIPLLTTIRGCFT